MQHKEYGELVGILVGTIMKGAKPLLIALYIEKGGAYHTRGIEDEGKRDVDDVARRLAKTYSAVLKHVWHTSANPRWYFLQFKSRWTPNCLGLFGLPWVVYERWERIQIMRKALHCEG